MNASATVLTDLLDSLAFVAVEHGDSLDLAGFVNLVDLYAHHLREAEARPGAALPFEAFVRDGMRLARAAEAAEHDSGVRTVAPAPIGDDADASVRPPDTSDPAFAGFATGRVAHA